MKNKETHHSDMEHDHGKMKDMKENKKMQDQKTIDHSTYTCPMHPEIKQDHPGNCPECGMTLVSADHGGNMDHESHAGHESHEGHDMHKGHDQHAGHDNHEGHGGHVNHSGHEQMFRKKFWISLFLAIPVLLYSQSVQKWLGFNMPAFFGSDWIVPVFSLIIFLYGGIPFLQMAVPEVRKKRPGMMALISLAISVAFVYSIATTLFPIGESFYWELVTLIVVMLFGHWMEMRSVRKASSALDELAKLMPDTAELVLKDGKTKTIITADLKSGDVILISVEAK